MSRDSLDRFSDLNKQGFMRSAYKKQKPKEPILIWHGCTIKVSKLEISGQYEAIITFGRETKTKTAKTKPQVIKEAKILAEK